MQDVPVQKSKRRRAIWTETAKYARTHEFKRDMCITCVCVCVCVCVCDSILDEDIDWNSDIGQKLAHLLVPSAQEMNFRIGK